jgi:hypothetical protein
MHYCAGSEEAEGLPRAAAVPAVIDSFDIIVRVHINDNISNISRIDICRDEGWQ